jgi:hypothetical protein
MATRPSLTMPTRARPLVPSPDPALPAQAPLSETPAAKGRASQAPSRVGKVQLGGYLPPDAKRQLDVWAAMNGRTMQSMIEEMVNDFCAKHGLHRLIDD